MKRRRSKTVAKSTFFIILGLIIALTLTTIFGVSNYYADKKITYIKGVSDIRWGIDIRGGVEAIYVPDIKNAKIDSSDMNSAKQIIETRLVNEGINDYEVYVDESSHQVIVRFPWQSDEEDFDPTAAVQELGETAMLTFCEGSENNKTVLLKGEHVKEASAGYTQDTGYVVQLNLTSEGSTLFANATQRLKGQTISIWMDDVMLSAPTVNDIINNGQAIISGDFTSEEADDLASKINAGSLPFSLTVDDSKLQIISPTLGNEALYVMTFAGIAAYLLVIILIITKYRLPGVVASLALLGQIVGILAVTSGFFPGVNGLTMTIPGIAGIILSIGMGIDANVIAAERIKEEFENGKTIDGAVDAGFNNSFSAVLDGNMTVLIVACVLMGTFGSPDSFLTKIFSIIMPFGSSVTGIIYSFGYTLFLGVIFTMIMGVLLSKLMLKSVSRIKLFRNPWLYGGAKNAKK